MPHIRSPRSLQNNKEGVERWREGSSLRGWQTDSEPACPLSSDRQMSPLPAWPAADQGRAMRLLKWRNLRAPQGVSWSFDVQHKGRVWCWMSWGREADTAVCYKGPAWRAGKEGKILSTDRPLLYFICFVRGKMVVKHMQEFGVGEIYFEIPHRSVHKTNYVLTNIACTKIIIIICHFFTLFYKTGAIIIFVMTKITQWTMGEWYWHKLWLKSHWNMWSAGTMEPWHLSYLA